MGRTYHWCVVVVAVCHSRHLRRLARRVGEPESGTLGRAPRRGARPPLFSLILAFSRGDSRHGDGSIPLIRPPPRNRSGGYHPAIRPRVDPDRMRNLRSKPRLICRSSKFESGDYVGTAAVLRKIKAFNMPKLDLRYCILANSTPSVPGVDVVISSRARRHVLWHSRDGTTTVHRSLVDYYGGPVEDRISRWPTSLVDTTEMLP
jgi:hypothetical protein